MRLKIFLGVKPVFMKLNKIQKYPTIKIMNFLSSQDH